MIAENLSTLKIHKLTQEQFDRELANGNIDDNALYLTPDESVTKSYVDLQTDNVSNNLADNYYDAEYISNNYYTNEYVHDELIPNIVADYLVVSTTQPNAASYPEGALWIKPLQ